MKARFFDFIHYVTVLNSKKIGNIFLNYISYIFSIIFKKSIHWGMPVSASIEATTNCNLQCVECPSGQRKFSRPTGSISIDNFKKYLDPISHYLTYLIIYFQGEPYLNKFFFEMVRYAKTKRIYTATSTNGHFLNDENAKKTIESKLDKLIISLDGTDQETYSSYRKNGNFDNVISGIKNLVEWKTKLKSTSPYIIIQFLVLKTNEHKITEIKQLAKDLQVDELQLKTAQIYGYKNDNSLIPSNGKYSRYFIGAEGKVVLKKKIKNRCLRLWQSLVITWDGDIVPCCFDKDAEYKMGNLNKELFKKIWRNSSYKNFRKKVISNRNKIEICCNCSE